MRPAASRKRARIAVATDPFILRTGLHQCLSRDSRLESVLIPRGKSRDENLALSHEVDAVIVSEPMEVPDTLVVTYSPTGNTLELSRHGKKRTVPYRGIRPFVELLLAEIRA